MTELTPELTPEQVDAFLEERRRARRARRIWWGAVIAALTVSFGVGAADGIISGGGISILGAQNATGWSSNGTTTTTTQTIACNPAAATCLFTSPVADSVTSGSVAAMTFQQTAAITATDWAFNFQRSDALSLFSIDAQATALTVGQYKSTQVGNSVAFLATLGMFQSNAISGNQAFSVGVNGARIDFGAGASDYASSDGTTVTFAGPITGTGLVKSTIEDGLSEKLGSSSSTTSPIGGIANRTTPVSNGTTVETDLQSVTLPANGLTTTGHCVAYDYAGSTVNNANVKTVRVYFGATAMLTATMSASIATQWNGRAIICRTGASAQRYTVELRETNTASGAVKNFVAQGTLTETESGALALKLTGQSGTASNDVTQNLFTTSVY